MADLPDLQALLAEPVSIAYCPIHGLHGVRDRCYVCGEPCDQVQMVPALPTDPPAHGPFDADELVRWAELYDHPETWAKKAQELHGQNERLRETLEHVRDLVKGDESVHRIIDLALKATGV